MKQKRDLSSKPYYKCFLCADFRKTCGGMPTRDMTLPEWEEYMRDIRDYFGLSNDHITEAAQSSSGTTERIMAGDAKNDIMRSTARRYEQAEIGPVGDFICYRCHDNTATELINRLTAENEHLRKENERYAKIIDKYLD